MPNGLDDVAGSSFAFCADHGGAFGDAAEGFAQIAAAADEGDAVGVLLDVVGVVGGGEDFGLVDVVYADGLENLADAPSALDLPAPEPMEGRRRMDV